MYPNLNVYEVNLSSSKKHHGHDNHHGHHHGHRHGHHHNKHHNPQTTVIVIEKGGNKSNQGFYNNPSDQGFYNPGNQAFNQGFNNNFSYTNFNDNQGYEVNPYTAYNATPVQLFDFHPHQEFIIESGLGHDLVLDVSGDDHGDAQMIIWKKHNKPNQRFKIVQDKNHYGFYHIVSVKNHKLVSSSNNSSANGQFMYANHNYNLQGQSWQFEQAKGHHGNRFYIKNAFGKYLDVCEAKAYKGTPVIQYDYNGDKNQMWEFHPV